MTPQIKKRLLRTFVFSLIALAVGIGVGVVQIKTQNASSVDKGSSAAGVSIAGIQIGGPFALTDHTGAKVTEKTYEGQYKLVFFGFTHCPMICPTELQKIARVLKALEEKNPELDGKIAPLFITVDPERDTPEVMAQYVSLFHPKLIGLTGTKPQIEQIEKSYRVFSAKAQDEAANDYSMDHSSFTYLMGPDDTLLGMYRTEDSADEIYDDLTARLSSS